MLTCSDHGTSLILSSVPPLVLFMYLPLPLFLKHVQAPHCGACTTQYGFLPKTERNYRPSFVQVQRTGHLASKQASSSHTLYLDLGLRRLSSAVRTVQRIISCSVFFYISLLNFPHTRVPHFFNDIVND